MTDILIKNAYVVTMNEKKEILDRADVAIKGDRIAYVGPSKSWAQGSFEEVVEGEGMTIHSHSN